MPKDNWQRKKWLILVLGIISVIAAFCYFLKTDKGLLDFKKRVLRQSPFFYSEVAQLVQDLNSEVGWKVASLNLPSFQIVLSKSDIAHFADLYDKLEDQNFVNGSQYYAEHNDWRRAEMYYLGNHYDIKIKSHGVDPSGHRYRNYISYRIKLLDSKQIEKSKTFSLIINDRIRDKRLLAYDWAGRFNLLINEPRLVQVQVNNWPEKLYYFEPQPTNEFMEVNNKASYQVFGCAATDNKSSIITFENEFDENWFLKCFEQTLTDRSVPQENWSALEEHYLQINRNILKGDSPAVIKNFDREYLTSFLAANTLAGHTGHGFASNNLIIYLDTASGRFYPALKRDHVLNYLTPCENCAIETQMNYWDFLGARQKMLDVLDNDDSLRQEKYKKMYDFIEKYGAETIEAQNRIVREDNKLHYFGWLKLFLARIGLGIDEIPTAANLDFIKSYLETASPDIKFSTLNNALIVEIQPRSMSALRFTDFTDKRLIAQTALKQYVSLKIIQTDLAGNIETAQLVNGFVVRDHAGLHLAPLLEQIKLFDGHKDGERLARKYIIQINFFTKQKLSLNEKDLNIKLQNDISGEDVEISIENNAKNGNELAKFLTASIKPMVDVCNQWKLDNPSINFLCNTSTKEIIIQNGVHVLRHNVSLPDGYQLVIVSGAKILLDKDISIFGYGGININGTAELPVVITALDPKKPFGSIGILGTGAETSSIRFLNLSNGNQTWHNGAFFSGGLSIHHQKQVTISNAKISNNHADDGINLKYISWVNLFNNQFRNNHADQVDLDYCEGLVENNAFSVKNDEDSNGDGLDISGSLIFASGNTFKGSRDKGLSIGEASQIIVEQNIFIENNLGAAVKDASRAYFLKNIFDSNKMDIDVYQKKQIWGGAELFIDKIIAKTLQLNNDKQSAIFFLPANFSSNINITPDNIQAVFNGLLGYIYVTE